MNAAAPPRCECCDFPESMCGKAAEKAATATDKAARLELLSRPGWFTARYPGTCAGCGDRFAAGDPVTGRGHRRSARYLAGCCENRDPRRAPLPTRGGDA